jgi:SAM-dependent methyltransferase
MMRPSAPIRQDEQNHWDGVAAASPDEPSLWREQSDVVNGLLLDRWLPADGALRVLKTDLYDELVGPGLYPKLRPRASRVVGIDISPAAVDAVSARYPQLESVVADVRDLPFEDRCFDAVVSNSTLDHLSSRAEVWRALAELRRVLAPGGRLILTLDNPLNPVIALRNALPARMSTAVRRVAYGVGWTSGPRGVRSLLAGSGFEPRELTAVMHAPRVVIARAGGGATPGSRARWLSFIRASERLERLPTRYVTGHFVAALAMRAAAPDDGDRSAPRA